MKKILLLGSALIALMFSSCDEELESSPLSVDNTKTATVKCFFFADTDLTKPGNEAVPEDAKVKITFRYDYSDLDYAGSGSTVGAWTQTATVKTDGSVSITVPVDDDGVNLTISPASFEYDQIQADGAPSGTLKKTFTLSNQTVNIASGDIKVYNYNYSVGTTLENPEYTATISGYLYAELDKRNSGNEVAPAGTMVKVYSSNFETVVSVDGNGMYTANVKVDDNGDNFTVEAYSFTYNQKQPYTADDSIKVIQYNKVTGNVNGVMSSDSKKLNLTYSSLTDVTPEAPVNMVTIGGTIEADINTETPELETFNSGTKFVFYTSTWSKEVVVDASGTYTVDVPENENVYYSSDFEVPRRVFDIDLADYTNKTFRCKVDGDFVGSFDYEQGNVDLTVSDFDFTQVYPVN